MSINTARNLLFVVLLPQGKDFSLEPVLKVVTRKPQLATKAAQIRKVVPKTDPALPTLEACITKKDWRSFRFVVPHWLFHCNSHYVQIMSETWITGFCHLINFASKSHRYSGSEGQRNHLQVPSFSRMSP